MLTAHLVIGRDYPYRMKRAPGSPHQRVKLLAKVGRGCKVKIRFIDGPFPGLEALIAPNTHQVTIRDPKGGVTLC
jgi:hypothetical protein